MFNVLELHKNLGLDCLLVSPTKGGEHHGPCPGCGGTKRFHIWPEQNVCAKTGRKRGSYWCRDCGKTGDNIQFLVDFAGKPFHIACNELGIQLDKERGTRNGVAAPPPVKPKERIRHEWTPQRYPAPCEAWKEKAKKFVMSCHEQLKKNDQALSWLAGRGISNETIARFQLGFNTGEHGRDIYKDRGAWGLPEEDNTEGKRRPLWLPVGWVIPHLDSAGRVQALRIRRTNEGMQHGLGHVKYYIVPGGSSATFLAGRDRQAFVLVESWLDAILIDQEAGDLVGSVSTASAQAKPDLPACEILVEALMILDALDVDQAGANASCWWQEMFPTSYRLWPAPGGKDPGEAYHSGLNIREWILSGLPPGLYHWEAEGSVLDKMPGMDEQGERGKTTSDFPSDVQELAELLRRYSVSIKRDPTSKYRDEVVLRGISIVPKTPKKRISDLVFLSPAVGRIIDRHPAGVIHAGNLTIL